MSKSTGQIVGTVVGAVIGFFLPGGNVMLGAAIGGAIGGLVDPPKGPTIAGPRLDDLSFQTSTLGAPLGRAYGTVPVIGNVVWLEGDKYREVITEEEAEGGKGGGGGATYEKATYYATFAVSLLHIPSADATVSLRKLWIGSNLVFEAGSDNMESMVASSLALGSLDSGKGEDDLSSVTSQSKSFDFYSGTDDQQPNTRWQADKGANAVSGFPGRCYIVIYDLDLEPYSRSLAMAQVKAELVVGPSENQVDDLHKLSGQFAIPGTARILVCARIGEQGCQYAAQYVYTPTQSPSISQFYTAEYLVLETVTESGLIGAEGLEAPHILTTVDTDRMVILTQEPFGDQQGTSSTIMRWDYGGVIFEGRQVSITIIPYYTWSVAIKGGTSYFACDDGSRKIYIFNGDTSISTAANHAVKFMGVSENYLFAVQYTTAASATTTVWKFDRYDLTLIDTFTRTADGREAVIKVKDDSTFYTWAMTGRVYKWFHGFVVADLGVVLPSRSGTGLLAAQWFNVFSDAPFYGMSLSSPATSTLEDAYIKVGHGVIAQTAAKMHDIVTAECDLAGISAGDLDLSELTDDDVLGFRIGSAGPIRSSLEMLQAARPFDVAPSGYALRFVSRGGSSLATIPEVDLGAVLGGDSLPVLLPMSREMDTQIPYKVSVRYLDPAREYDIGEQYASRPDTASVSERTVELAIVMSGEDAAKCADVLNQKDWLERTAFGPFSLPPTYRNLEPPDVVTVEHRGQSHSIRLTRAEFLPDGMIECAGVYSAPQSYTSTATAQDPLTVGQSLVPLKGSTQGYLLDIPRLRIDQDVPGMAYGLTGLASGWPGGVLLRSDDSGTTWQSIAAQNSRTKLFACGAELSTHHGYSIDHGSVLTATPLHPDHTLSGVTETQLYAHANIAAYGVDGRWEVIAFRTATDNTGSYAVQDFLRGLYGTEWATGLHETGDLLVMLDTATVGFFGLPTNALNVPRLYRAVTRGASVESAESFLDTYEANNLKPLTVVDFSGTRDPVTLAWTIKCNRRTRWPVELFSGVDVPLAESTEGYKFRIFSADDFTEVIREVVTTTSSFVWTAAEQVTDLGANQPTAYVDAAQLSSVVGYGIAAQATLTCYLADDPYIDNVVLLMHMDGTNNSTTFTDVIGHTATANGTAKISTAQSMAGGSSALFDKTSGCYVSLAASSDWNVGSGDFTIEMYVWVNSYNTNTCRLFQSANGDVYAGLYITLTASGGVNIASSSTGSSFNLFNVTVGTIATGAWKHLAYVRNGTSWKVYIAGVGYAVATTSGTPYFSAAATPIIGGQSGTNRCLDGYIDELRFTKVARYTADFTPPTPPFPDP